MSWTIAILFFVSGLFLGFGFGLWLCKWALSGVGPKF